MTATASTFPSDPTDDKLALASIGQGDTTATPLQMAMVAQAIANNGKLMQPTLVDRVRAADLTVLSQTKPQTMANAFSKDSVDKLTTMMESVVSEANPQLAIGRHQGGGQNRYRTNRYRQLCHRRLGDRFRAGGRSANRRRGVGA